MTALLFFLFNPLIGFIEAFKNLDRHLNGLVFIAFYALFGYAISFNLTSADSYRIAAKFCQFDFDYQLIWNLYKNGQITDIYLLFVYGIVQVFTRNPKVLFGVLGAIMGVFSCLSIKQLFLIWKDNRNVYFYILVFFFFLTISFFNVNGIRFWTATSVFSYFAIRHLYFKKKTAIIGVLLTPLIHFGFIIAALGFLAFVLMNAFIKSPHIYLMAMVLAFGLSIAAPQSAIDDIMGSEGDVEELTSSSAIGRKADSYRRTSGNIQAERERDSRQPQSVYRKANSLFTKTFDYVNKIGMFLMLFVLYRRRKSIIQNETQSRLFNFVLFFFALGYIATLLISSGSRFIRIANMMYVFWLLTVFQQNNTDSRSWKLYVYALFFLNFYALAFLLINAPRLVTPIFWFLPPIATIVNGIGFAPIDFV